MFLAHKDSLKLQQKITKLEKHKLKQSFGSFSYPKDNKTRGNIFIHVILKDKTILVRFNLITSKKDVKYNFRSSK